MRNKHPWTREQCHLRASYVGEDEGRSEPRGQPQPRGKEASRWGQQPRACEHQPHGLVWKREDGRGRTEMRLPWTGRVFRADTSKPGNRRSQRVVVTRRATTQVRGGRISVGPQDPACHQGLARVLKVSMTDGFMLRKQGVHPDFLQRWDEGSAW